MFDINTYMKYEHHYNILIERAKNRLVSGYTEDHHIIPVCLGGDNSLDNLVKLTPEEHYVAHQLLVKMYPDNRKLIHAAVMMTVSANHQGRKGNNKLYGWLREKHAASMSVNQKGSNNSQYGTCWINKNQIAVKIPRDQLDLYTTKGWAPGRKQINNTKCIVCGTDTGSRQRRFCSDHRPNTTPPHKRGWKPTQESRNKLSEYCKSRKTVDHPQYGKRWVNNGIMNKMVPFKELDHHLLTGWNRGKIRQP